MCLMATKLHSFVTLFIIYVCGVTAQDCQTINTTIHRDRDCSALWRGVATHTVGLSSIQSIQDACVTKSCVDDMQRFKSCNDRVCLFIYSITGQGVVTSVLPVVTLTTGIKIESSDQGTFPQWIKWSRRLRNWRSRHFVSQAFSNTKIYKVLLFTIKHQGLLKKEIKGSRHYFHDQTSWSRSQVYQ